ncbi:Ig-like and fibronectin type-III domain-containing protein C25G4.10 [Orchesella cincta]|uniref:Ig-like and fibronectin type-III domain-containing protein C25G4.10 n=1 Tax=Orchesella cincta TaxID=48709 RepID=A0A1D2MU58_ORCCI|nr:Ig-like and fibronectin type-III domain-containing protein C25G4.10 [Orchesella cincta]
MHDSIQNPVTVAQGENAPLTCVVRDLGDSTVVWKKWENGKSGPKILTAGETRVTSDERIRIIHDNVISLGISAPNSSIDLPSEHSILDDYASYKGVGSILSHNYTACCQQVNVSKSCYGFCTLQSILEGTTGEPNQCEDEFPKIVKCMADGRDHVPCCIREQVPDICQDLCRGEYTVVTDNVKTHFSCPTYIERTLSCIADGIEILPSQPLNVQAVAVSPTAINLTWAPPRENRHTVHEYVVNITTLRSFDAPFTGLVTGLQVRPPRQPPRLPHHPILQQRTIPQVKMAMVLLYPIIMTRRTPTATTATTVAPSTIANSKEFSNNGLVTENGQELSAEDKVEAKMRQIKVHDDKTTLLLEHLQPFTMYEISVSAFNIHGRSLPSNRVRALTLAPGVIRPEPKTAPKLPDIKSCCITKGVNTESCVSKLCDPKLATQVEIPDLMICAPWTPEVFSCLADGKDHSPCCRARGIPAPCYDLCTGNITKLDYHYFKCLRYMGEYGNCLMEGYGVLPTAPRQLRVSNVQEDFAIIHWSPPSTLNDTVTGYLVHYRPLSTFENEYHHVKAVHPPYILENLYSNAEYEVYVEAMNEHGVSLPSQRVVFRTASTTQETEELEAAIDNYNETACCVAVGMNPTCLPLCSYDASMSDIRSLAFACASEFHTLLRCAAGGRDHSACCTRRGVSENCLDICSARVPDSLLSMAENCLPYIGNIVQCFEEGTELIPGPVEEFHSNLVTDSSVGLSWLAPKNYDISNYQVFYQVKNPSSASSSVDKPADPKSLNTTDTSIEVTGLTKGQVYRFFVVAINAHGSSIPSSVILVNVTRESYNGTKIPGVLTPPHSLVVAGHSATWVQIVWQPPIFAHPTDKITYKVYHKGVKEANFQMNDTLVNSITLDSLRPNSQYIVYATATNNKGESEASETLIAWTDPAHSPFVEPPRIQPMNLLVEGRTMTVVCVALGDPTPTISLYINGKLIKQQKNRHLTQVVENITREMDIVSCYADNGYGTPMQSARRIQISHAPSVTGSEINFATEGEAASIECIVTAHPEPKVVFWKNSQDRIPIVNGGNYRIEHDDSVTSLEQQSSRYRYVLRIQKVSSQDVGNYSCHAENAIGESVKTFWLQTRDIQDMSGNITECCIKEKVSPSCIDACSFYLDIESVIDKPQCLPDFDKLMKCSADGRDHRACCSSWGVPRRCLDWCRGEPVSQNSELCVLQNSKVIFNCFKENRDKLPGPPKRLRIQVLSDTEIMISWDAPTINPHTASSYRVFWRPVGQKLSQRLDTHSTNAKISHLKPGVKYEAVVKAGNSHGTSTLTDPITFITEDNLISSASTAEGSHAGMGIGIAFLVFLLVGITVGAVWFIRKRQFGTKPPGAIAFENPSYIRETNPDASSHATTTNGDIPMNGNGSVPSVSNGVIANGWHTETLHPPRAETEVAPTLYEELRLGSEGAGFRRLKP